MMPPLGRRSSFRTTKRTPRVMPAIRPARRSSSRSIRTPHVDGHANRTAIVRIENSINTNPHLHVVDCSRCYCPFRPASPQERTSLCLRHQPLHRRQHLRALPRRVPQACVSSNSTKLAAATAGKWFEPERQWKEHVITYSDPTARPGP